MESCWQGAREGGRNGRGGLRGKGGPLGVRRHRSRRPCRYGRGMRRGKCRERGACYSRKRSRQSSSYLSPANCFKGLQRHVQRAPPSTGAVGPPPPPLPYKVDTSRPSLRTNWTRLGNRIGRGGAREARARACRPQKRAKDLMRGCLLWKSRSPCRGARAREAAAEAAVGARGDSCHLLQRILYRHGVSCL